ncbi:hypothetical protein ABB02_00859 [Clostridiaceae bacterium JG1575]|nr:hypothetical protein ABB02_00859 [Clostridiaceae bacterium JG1575]
MTARDVLKLVEWRTKGASLLPFAAGSLYALFRFGTFSWLRAVLFFVALLALDAATTVQNNLAEAQGPAATFCYDGTEYTKGTVRRLLVGLWILSLGAGTLLAVHTGPVVWLIGLLGVLTALTYSSGPLPLCRTPFGEAVSGLAMGLGIFFLAVYLHPGDALLRLWVFQRSVHLELDYREVGAILLLCVPFVSAIANLMLANNLCDAPKDRSSGRYTLAVLWEASSCLVLFHLLYALGGLAALIAVFLRILPLSGLLLLLVYGFVWRNAQRFSRAPSRARTFHLVVENLWAVGLGMILSLALGLLVF